MKTFRVVAEETISYTYIVKAKDPEEAMEKVIDAEPETMNNLCWNIESIEEIKEGEEKDAEA